MIDTREKTHLAMAEHYFNGLVQDWARAEKECQRRYVLWQEACRSRERLAILKNNAWGELEMARAFANQQRQD